ncbi:heavy-metal-associated domain-containing protein [Candidatus Nucleicultrix amoebiphila]|uniref:HMA domain-containing protein n=1 Tax=Candidatus Nucleicultrix amoebiphila FS5 TaxID=1414854 RepID=A0A1W6N4J3_9PROT|nr:cation transporter [Candidatus Nucleicultrix amoebiphila]ARN84790.1 hypothetical protein GQ61_05230 [Candidatus Nucleicultrix amoebiphila FS5]
MKNLLTIFFMGSFLAVSAFAVQLSTIELSVQNMTCNLCPITVRKALETVPGVKEVSVDLKTKVAKVTYDKEKAKLSDLAKATTEAGYPSKLLRR